MIPLRSTDRYQYLCDTRRKDLRPLHASACRELNRRGLALGDRGVHTSKPGSFPCTRAWERGYTPLECACMLENFGGAGLLLNACVARLSVRIGRSEDA